jgi:hypothetical protein
MKIRRFTMSIVYSLIAVFGFVSAGPHFAAYHLAEGCASIS